MTTPTPPATWLAPMDLLREVIDPLEVSAGILADEDGGAAMEDLLTRIKQMVTQFDESRAAAMRDACLSAPQPVQEPPCGQVNSGTPCDMPRRGDERVCPDCNPRAVQEPVVRTPAGDWTDARRRAFAEHIVSLAAEWASTTEEATDCAAEGRLWEAAYAGAAPAEPASQPTREGLSEAQIDAMWAAEKQRSADMSLPRQWLRFARAIERAHNIGSPGATQTETKERT